MDAGPVALTPRQVADLLESALAVIAAEGAVMPDRVLSWRPAPGEWCVKEVLGHLIEAERRGFAGRIRLMLASDSPALEAWDPDAVARQRNDHERRWDDLIGEFRGLRSDAIPLARGLTDRDLARGAAHPTVGMLRVSDLLHEWVHHDRNHIRQMMANVQALAWPHMGNAQRFSAVAASTGGGGGAPAPDVRSRRP